jgi:hypothetical protein
MALPEQIRKQSEAVQELYKQLGAEDSGADTTSASDENSSTGDNAGTQADSADTSVSSVDQSTEKNERSTVDGPSSESYEQQWRSLQGMYNATNNRLQSVTETNKEYQSRIAQMEQLLASLSTVPSNTTPIMANQNLVSESDRNDYGESIDVMRKVSREELYPVAAKIASIEATINQLAASLNTSVLPQVQRVAHQQAMSSEERFWTALSNSVPNWQQINNDSGFQNWLLSIDPLTGISRQTYLEQAQNSLDVNRVVAFFQSYSESSGKFLADANAQPNRSAVSSQLEKQVNPGRSKGGSPPATQNAKTYTAADITDFFNKVRQGVYRGKEDERDRIERDIFAAQRDGRIVVNG